MVGWLTVQVWLLRAALLALPALVWLAWRPARAWLQDVPRAAWFGLAAVVVGGAVARAAGSIWSVNHENAIGWVIFEDAFALDHVPSYGLGGHVLYHAVLSLLPTAPASVFAVNFALATLTPALAFLVAWGLLRHGPSALLTAALLAFHPAHVRLSASESLHVPLLFFSALGLAALLCALARDPSEDGRPGPEGDAGARRLEDGRQANGWQASGWVASAPLLLAAVALALAVQTRPLGALLVVPVALIFALRTRRPLAWLHSPTFWGAFAVASALTAAHVAFLWSRVTADDGGLSFFRVAPGDILPRLLEPAQHALVDPAVTPFALQLLVLLGVVALVVFDRRALAILLPTALVYTWFHTTHGENPVDQLRFGMGPLPWLALLGGAALLPLSRLLPPTRTGAKIAAAGTAAALLLAASGLVWQRDVVSARYDTQREAAFFRAALPHLPERGVLVQLDRFSADRILTTALPTWWFRAAGHDLRPIEARRFLADPSALRGDAPVVWYRGVTCWAFDKEIDLRRPASSPKGQPPKGRPPKGQPEGGEGCDPRLRPECRELEQGFRLTPLVETSFPANPDRFLTVARTLTIGFYRVEGLR